MQTAKLFKNGGSLAVRLPKEFIFEGSEVYIRKVGDEVILSSKKPTVKDLIKVIESFPVDFMEDYKPLPEQERDWSGF